MKKNMRLICQSLFALCLLCSLSSYLESGLDDLPAYSDAEIISFQFEHRWEQPIGEGSDNTRLGVISLATDVRIEGTDIYCTITVPEAGNPSSFTEEIRADVRLDRIVGIATISTAATISPVGNAPVLGKWGDFSQPCTYKVVAADGVTSKEWTIHCTLVK